MLTRRHLRIKVMQSLYSFLQNREGNLAQEVDFFKKSYLNTFSLYLALLAFLKSIYEHAIDQKDLQGNWFWYYHENDNNNLIQINIRNDSIILVDYFFLPQDKILYFLTLLLFHHYY